jgi:hypothetical protein
MFGAEGGFFQAAGGEVEALGGAQFARRSEFFQGFAPRVIGGSLGGHFHLEWMLPGGLGFNVDFRPVLEILVTLSGGGAASLAASAACPLLMNSGLRDFLATEAAALAGSK